MRRTWRPVNWARKGQIRVRKEGARNREFRKSWVSSCACGEGRRNEGKKAVDWGQVGMGRGREGIIARVRTTGGASFTWQTRTDGEERGRKRRRMGWGVKEWTGRGVNGAR